MKDPESGELLLAAWKVLLEGGFIVIAKGMYDFVGGDQADLKRLLQIFGFRKWTRLAHHVLIGSRKIDPHSITSQQPLYGYNSDTWRAITFFLEKNGIIDKNFPRTP